ncbi:MAG: aminotransferase class V-fold PLP-dependent enzyme [Limibacillus sp.]
MTLSNGREFLSIPGPTTVPDRVLGAMHQPAIEIYGGRLFDITRSCLADMKKIFKTEGETYIYISNGHGAWEAAVSNTLSRGEKVLVLDSGRFARGWGEMADTMGIEVEVLPGDWRAAVDPAALEARLKADSAGEIKAVMVVQVDTASGVVNDIPALRKAIDAAGHGALFMVDCIACLATIPFEMDAWGVDVTVTGSQKGLMCPPGLGFVAASDKARAKSATADLKTRYWDWSFREGPEHYQKYCGTAPVHMLYGLREALNMIFEEGLENIFERHRLLAGATRRAVEVWSEGAPFEFNILEPSQRSDAITMVRCQESMDPAALLAYLKQHLGVVLGIAIGEMSGKGFRIAHMGHVNAPMMLGTLGALETALAALGIPHGKGGVSAAAAYLGEALKGR